jgi:hypothetical protein
MDRTGAFDYIFSVFKLLEREQQACGITTECDGGDNLYIIDAGRVGEGGQPPPSRFLAKREKKDKLDMPNNNTTDLLQNEYTRVIN